MVHLGQLESGSKHTEDLIEAAVEGVGASSVPDGFPDQEEVQRGNKSSHGPARSQPG